MLLYMRHGDDRDHGDSDYRHDRHLNDRGREKASKAARCMIEKYGHPNIVYVSPFRRAIETLDAMSDRFDRPVDVRRDPKIAQYLRHKAEPQVSPETAKHIAIAEDRDAFRRRVADHVDEARRQNGTTHVIWGITHQIVIEEIAVYFNVELSDDLDFLDQVVMIR